MFLISHFPALQERTGTVGGRDRDPLVSPSAAEGVEVKSHMLEVITTLDTKPVL